MKSTVAIGLWQYTRNSRNARCLRWSSHSGPARQCPFGANSCRDTEWCCWLPRPAGLDTIAFNRAIIASLVRRTRWIAPQELTGIIALGRHRTLAPDAWNGLAVRAAIEEIAADAIAQFDPDTFWPGHPSDDGVGYGNPSFYTGAAGVIWALDYLHRIGAVSVARDFRPVLPQLLERTIAGFENNSPTDYGKHGSLLKGDMGAALLAMRLAPTWSLADLVHRRAEANMGLPI